MNKEQMPWGFRAVLVDKEEYSSIVYVIKEGERLPYLYHKRRTKSWTVLQGVIQYTLEGQTKLVGEGETLHISPRLMHRAMAIKGDATVIETGTKLLDDAIVVETDYGEETG